MSYTELHIGTLKEIDLGELTIEDWCKSKCDELELELYNEDYDWKYYSYLELLLDTHPEYKVFHNKLYICDDRELKDGEINKVIKMDLSLTLYSFIMEEPAQMICQKSIQRI